MQCWFGRIQMYKILNNLFSPHNLHELYGFPYVSVELTPPFISPMSCLSILSHFISSLWWLIIIPVKTFYISHHYFRRIFYPSSPIVKNVDLKILDNASDSVFVYWLSLLCRHLIDTVYLLSLTLRSLLLINKIDWLLIFVLKNLDFFLRFI